MKRTMCKKDRGQRFYWCENHDPKAIDYDPQLWSA